MKKWVLLAIASMMLLGGCAGGGGAGVDATAPVPSASAIKASELLASGAGDAEDALDDAGTPAVSHDLVVDAPVGDVVEIREKMFVAQTNDIYFNTEDYLGKTLKYEGLFDIYEDPDTGMTYYAVIRYGPGCCGVDANAGFEVEWEGGYPEQDDWVEAVGVLEEYEEDDIPYLRVRLSSLTVLPTRGAEYVTQ